MAETTPSGAANPAAPDLRPPDAKAVGADGLDQIKKDFRKKLAFLVWFATFSAGKVDRLSTSMPVEEVREEWRRDARIMQALVEDLATPGKALVKLLDLAALDL